MVVFIHCALCFLFCCVFVLFSLRCVFVLFTFKRECLSLCNSVCMAIHTHRMYIYTYDLYELRMCDYLHIDTLKFLSIKF